MTADLLRNILNYYLTSYTSDNGLLKEALGLSVGMVAMFHAQELDNSANKARNAVVILHLEMGDVVAVSILCEYVSINIYFYFSTCYFCLLGG